MINTFRLSHNSLSSLSLKSLDEIIDNLKTCCDINSFQNKNNQTLDQDIIPLEKGNLLTLGNSDLLIVLCNARIIELYLNSQYDSSVKGLHLCKDCDKTDEKKYFYVLKSVSRNDKIEIKLVGLLESQSPIIYNVCSIIDENVPLAFNNHCSGINWTNVDRMLNCSKPESPHFSPAVKTLFESVKNHAQMTNLPIQTLGNQDISEKLNSITNQLNRVESKLDAIYNHLFVNQSEEVTTRK